MCLDIITQGKTVLIAHKLYVSCKWLKEICEILAESDI